MKTPEFVQKIARGIKHSLPNFQQFMYILALSWSALLLYIYSGIKNPDSSLAFQLLAAIVVPFALLLGFELTYRNHQRGLLYQKTVEAIMECASLMAQIAHLYEDQARMPELQKRLYDIYFSSKFYFIGHWIAQTVGKNRKTEFEEKIFLLYRFLDEKHLTKHLDDILDTAIEVQRILTDILEPALKSIK